MKTFCFTVDDNIRFFKEINSESFKSIFEHPYLGMYLRLHEKFGLKVQLNLFYETEDFNLSLFTDRYKSEWQDNADWLKLSFHSKLENVKPYEFSDYKEVYDDCHKVHAQIERFAGSSSLGKTTTIHYCVATNDGIKALADNNLKGLLGLFGDDNNPRYSYAIDEKYAKKIRAGEIVNVDGVSYSAIDIVLNCFSTQEIINQLSGLTWRDNINVMIHEQYFYKDFNRYQPNFEEKLFTTFDFLTNHGYKSSHFEDLIK